jgi:hypothetical protein
MHFTRKEIQTADESMKRYSRSLFLEEYKLTHSQVNSDTHLLEWLQLKKTTDHNKFWQVQNN